MNRLSINQVAIDYSRPINNRAKLDTGKLCNYRCEFCYYKDQLNTRDSLDVIRSRVDYILSYGIDEIDLSGGESSVEPNWFHILEYCQGKFKRISCLSHGGKFSDRVFTQKSYELGLREILFSVHGTDEKTHDAIVGRSGAFKNLMKAIEVAHLTGIEVRINTTVYNANADKIDIDVIKSLHPTQVNFIALNYWQDNDGFESVDYEFVCDNVKRYIDQLKTQVQVNARYFPICYMQGYEEYVKTHYHHIYDVKDWNKAIYNGTLDTSIKYTHQEKVDQQFAEADRMRLMSYFKTTECTQCKHFFVCDGIEKQLRGKVNPIPVSGEKVMTV